MLPIRHQAYISGTWWMLLSPCPSQCSGWIMTGFFFLFRLSPTWFKRLCPDPLHSILGTVPEHGWQDTTQSYSKLPSHPPPGTTHDSEFFRHQHAYPYTPLSLFTLRMASPNYNSSYPMKAHLRCICNGMFIYPLSSYMRTSCSLDLALKTHCVYLLSCHLQSDIILHGLGILNTASAHG